MAWSNVQGSTATWAGIVQSDPSRQFLGLGSIAQGAGDVDFVLSLDEDRVIYFSENPPLVLLQEVMESP